MKKLPPHILYAIEHEEKCIELRKDQIKSYRKKIKLLKSGMKMGEVNREIIPIKSGFQYNTRFYWKLKRGWLNGNKSL